MITFENISKNYKDVVALINISFEIKEGEIFGYIGPNGAGKTTTIKIMVGLIKDFGGVYNFKNITISENITQVSRMLGYLPQAVSFQDWRTVDQALTTFGKLSGLNKDELEHQIESLLVLFDLLEMRYKKISKLSGGMIQKVGLIQALLHKPKLLVLDEPLSGLDPASRVLFQDELKGFYKSNVMLVLWIGLPILSIISFLFFPELNSEVPASTLSSGIVSSVAGWLASIMLAVHIIHEKSHHVYDLFLIRPVTRTQIIFAKFFAVYFCVALASILAILLSFLIDYIVLNRFSSSLLLDTIQSLIISFSIISIECAAGAFIGVSVSTVLVGIILIIITHNIASLSIIMPLMTEFSNPILSSSITGIFLTIVFLTAAVWMFNRKQF